MIDCGIDFANAADPEVCKRFDFTHVSETELLRAIEDRRIVLAKVQGGVIGYLRFSYIWCSIPYIELIVVEKKYRGQGVGKAMLAFVIKKLKTIGKQMILTSSQSNESMPQKWNQSAGFKEIGYLDSLNEDGSKEIFYRKDF